MDKLTVSESPETILTRVKEQQAANLFSATDGLEMDASNPEKAVYYHMTTWKGKKCFTAWGNNIETLIKYEIIEPIYEEEKKDYRKIPYPVVMNHFMPKK